MWRIPQGFSQGEAAKRLLEMGFNEEPEPVSETSLASAAIPYTVEHDRGWTWLHFDARPGAVELFETKCLTGQGPSTHGPAPLAFLDVLKMVYDCQQVVLGIQPAQVGFGKPMSQPVKDAVQRVVQAFMNLSTPSPHGPRCK